MNNFKNGSHKIILDSIDTLCRIFWGPDPDQCRALFEGGLTSLFGLLAQELKINIRECFYKIKSISDSYSDTDALCKVLNEEYVRLFISHRDGIAAPLYESCYEYENAPLMGPAAVRMKDLFESEGLALADNFNEPPDHLSIELEYLYFLLNSSEENEKNSTLNEASEFASEIMLPWVKKFHDKLALQHPDSFYTCSADILLGLLGLIRDSAFFKG